MKNSLPSVVRRAPVARSPRLALLLVTAGLALASSALAQNNADTGGRRRGGDTNGQDRGGRGNFDPAEMQARMLSSIRERLEVTDDEEWKLISARLLKVSELRRAGGGGMGFGGRGGPPPGGGGDTRGGTRGTRGGGGMPEMELLSSALRDKLPDAEIKMRLDRLRDARKANEAALARAQEELRQVLSVRQEAVAVMFGLLP